MYFLLNSTIIDNMPCKKRVWKDLQNKMSELTSFSFLKRYVKVMMIIVRAAEMKLVKVTLLTSWSSLKLTKFAMIHI